MKGKALAEDVPVQDFLKKKKKKKKKKELQDSSNHGKDESVEEPELGRDSPLLFEEASQGGEGSKKKKKKAKIQGGKQQQASIADYCVTLEHKISNGNGLGAAQKKKKRKRRREGSPEESEGVTCVPVNQHSPGGCQGSSVDYVFLKKSPRKKRKNLPGEGEEPPLERPSGDSREGGRRKRRKRKGSSSQEGQGDTEGAAELSLLSPPGHKRPGGHRGGQRHQGGDSDAASVTSELSEEAPADFSTPNKAAGRAPATPARATKAPKSSTFVLEESSSESEGIRTPEPSASNKKKAQNSSFAEMAASDEISLDEDEDLENVTSSFLDVDTARQELEEFIPHVKNISDSSIKKMAGRDLARFKQFKKQGIAVRFGRFTQKENNQIRRNVEEFLSISGIDSAEKLMFTFRYPEEKETIHHLKAKYQFCEKISEGIPRPWRLIYYRARKMFDPNNYKGRYTKEEKEKLKKYYSMHGNDWKKISELMSRSNLSVAMKFSEIKSPVNYGPWTNEEIQKLRHAVKEVMKRRLGLEGAGSLPSEEPKEDLWVEREKLCQQLPWTEIEARVGTRYWRQCKQKWNSILTKKMSKGQQSLKGIKALQTKIALIKSLHEMQVEDANEVNWEELSNALGGVPRSYLQVVFYRVKVSCVPFWQKKSFSDIIDFLVEHKLPAFEEALKKKERKYLNSDNLSASQEQKAFLFSDIFDSSEDSD